MTYDFKKRPNDFGWVTNEIFDEELKEVLAGQTALEILDIPGIYEILSEHYNNEVLTNLQRHREEEEDDLREEVAEAEETLEAEDT
jgi:hypothetical protein